MAPRERTPAMIVALETLPRVAWWLLPHPMWPHGIGYFGFFHDCPNGHPNFYGIDVEQSTFEGNDANFVVTCSQPDCQATFDLAPGQHVEVSTLGGKVSVRQIVAGVRDLRDTLSDAPQQTVLRMQTALAEKDIAALYQLWSSLSAWADRHPHAAQAALMLVTGVLSPLLVMWLTGDDPAPTPVIIEEQTNVTIVVEPDASDADIERYVREALRGSSDEESTNRPMNRR